jgi:hypothetical protein
LNGLGEFAERPQHTQTGGRIGKIHIIEKVESFDRKANAIRSRIRARFPLCEACVKMTRLN